MATSWRGNGGIRPPDRGLIIYDGGCGFCTASVRWLTRHARTHPEHYPWQELDLDRFGLSPSDCEQRMYFVSPGGEVSGGAAAVAAALRHSSKPWVPVGVLLALPGVRRLAESVYRRVAANRYRLPGASGACVLPDRSEPGPGVAGHDGHGDAPG